MEKTIEFQTKCGSVKGYQRNGVYRFLGIPFAENPQRFKRSVELKKFAHPIDAKENQGSCYQFGGNFDGDTTPNQGGRLSLLEYFHQRQY
jgi:carboxylesterase type B